MKHTYLLFSLFICSFFQAQIITFPDANFKAKLLQANSTNMIAYSQNNDFITIDTNADGEIQLNEAQNVSVLDVRNSTITDLTGISSFTNLIGLSCSYNSLTTLNIDNSIELWFLDASHNQLNSISVAFEPYVEALNLSHNNLTSFSASGVIFADLVDLTHNQLTNLSFSNCNFYSLRAEHNNLSSVDFNGNSFIHSSVNFSNNQFTLLDLSSASFDNSCIVVLGNNPVDNIKVSETLTRPGNLYYRSDNSTLDVGNFHSSTSCDPEYEGHIIIENSPNLQNVILKNGLFYGYYSCNEGGTVFQNPSLSLNIVNCPNLNHICVDEGTELTVVQDRINQLGLQSQVVVDSNCTSSVLNSETMATDEQFVVSPVPASTFLQITASDNLVIDGLEIYNNLGQIVQFESAATRTIDVSKLATGSYFLKIKTQEGSFIKQFLKE
jgi:hypothetical protein